MRPVCTWFKNFYNFYDFLLNNNCANIREFSSNALPDIITLDNTNNAFKYLHFNTLNDSCIMLSTCMHLTESKYHIQQNFHGF